MKIAPADPHANYLAHRGEIDTAIARVLNAGRYILGPEVESFEREFAAYLGVAHVVGVANGTDALAIALRACGIGPGDQIATVSHTAVATVAAIELMGAIPVLVDIDPATFTIDCDALEKLDVRAILPVHLYGHPADMPRIIDLAELAQRRGVKVIEDCAQSHGASIDGRNTGAWGDAAAFSFYPTKNLGAIGDGGAVATNDPHVADRARSLREYGWKERYVSESPGMNSRLDELQAAILRVKLRHLDRANARRREIADAYSSALAGTDLVLPTTQPRAVHAWHQYVIRSSQRDRLREALRQHGIGTLIHYPVPVHMQPAYRGRLNHGPLPESERAAEEVLSLPIYPELGSDATNAVAAALLQLT
jgi:dTDP-4-amino-4,6-dideoxygalactose transaminase